MFLKASLPLLFALSLTMQAVEIRVATFNVGAKFEINSGGIYVPDYGIGPAGSPDHDTVRDVLARIDADVVSLQEIHEDDVAGNDLSDLAASLGYPYFYVANDFNTFDPSLLVAYLSRFPFTSQTLITSPAGSKDMTRLIPVVKVDVPGTTRDPVFYGAHLKVGTNPSEIFQRTVEMRRLVSHLAASGLTSSDNFVILGDLNFNPDAGDRTFEALPTSGLPQSFDLGPDLTFPIDYFVDPTDYFSNPGITRIIPLQLDNSPVTRPATGGNGEGTSIDLFMVSPMIGTRPLHTEIYNSVLDTSNTSGLPKAGLPLPPGTSAAASDHFAVFGDIELDPPLPYAFIAPGQTVTETFDGFTGTYDPYPWATSGGSWRGVDGGTSTVVGFRAYGSGSDPSLGFLPGTSPATVTASFVNQSPDVLSALHISFTAEQWRSANGGTSDTLSAELILNGLPQPLTDLTFEAATDFPNGAVSGGNSTSKNMTITGLSVAPGAPFELKFTFTPGAGGGLLPADVFINEFSYDNAGADTGEFVEVVTGPGFTGSPAEVVLLLYNGSGGATYGSSHPLSGFTVGNETASGHRIYSKLIASIQNGNPDGFALVVAGMVTQFISYGGSFQATTGTANGMISTNIGETQTTGEIVGQASLGLTGSGGNASNFNWTKFTGLPHSPGQPNPGQTFTVPTQPQGIAIDNLAVTFLTGGDTDGDGFSDADEAVFGTDPTDAGSRFVMTFANQTPAPGMARLTFPTMTGRSYTVESCTDFSDWEDEVTYPGTGSPEVVDYPVLSTEPKRFYRIRVTLADQ